MSKSEQFVAIHSPGAMSVFDALERITKREENTPGGWTWADLLRVHLEGMRAVIADMEEKLHAH